MTYMMREALIVDHERGAAQLIAYFTASLPDGTILPDLDFFAVYYLDPIRMSCLSFPVSTHRADLTS